MAKSKGINLSPRDKPKTKQDKYSEISDIKNSHKFNIEDKVFFVGLVTKYRGQECIITKRNTRKDIDYYKIKFDDDMELKDITVGYLKTSEEYQQWLLEQENKDEDDQSNMSEFEIELNKRGIESHRNYHACLSPLTLVQEMQCDNCGYEDRCVYKNKRNYKKFKFN